VRTSIITLLIVGLVAIARPSVADEQFVVIVHPKNEVTKLDKKTIADAFLKKRTQWNDDQVMQPVDQTKKSSVRGAFSNRILDRSVSSVRTYWNQLVFSGRAVPPPEVESDAAVVAYVAANPGAIGYVTSAANVKSVKIIQVK
jgi:ABC-type phosphate transport system substrate-binding protein